MRKLTLKEIEEKDVKKIFNRILYIEKQYGITLTRRACFRYYLKRGNELKLKREIKERESELSKLKTKIK